MRRILFISAALAVISLPVSAQESEGKSLMERGAELFLEGLRQEMEPTFEELQGLADQIGPAMQSFLQEMGPALVELGTQVRDWSAYEAPEMLPNGDIIIRKKPKTEPPETPDAPDNAPEGFTDI